MSTSFRLLLSRQLYTEVLTQAQAELPNECCGLLVGHVEATAEGSAGRVLRRYPLVNASASPREFESEPRSMLAADKDMRKEGWQVLAIYHSHPSSPPVPSRTDVERNYYPDVMTLIVSLLALVPEMGAWWLEANGYRPGEVIVLEP